MVTLALKLAGCAVLGYLLGSVSSAVLVSRIFEKKDIRTEGSGNAGATNMARVFGWGAGLATFGCDIVKTIAAMLLGMLIAGRQGMMAAGLFCFTGHCFPLYFHFKGGKGITVGAAAAIMLSPWMFLLILAIFAVVVALTKRVSAASVAAASAYPVFPLIMLLRGEWPAGIFVCCFIIGGLAVFMHRGNIKRLLNGTEPEFKAGSKKKKE